VNVRELAFSALLSVYVAAAMGVGCVVVVDVFRKVVG